MTDTGNNGRRAALHSLGCKVNAYETEVMQQQLEDAGYRIVPFDQEADVYIINTCSVTNMADRKSRQMLHRARKLNPAAVITAVGCYVQTAREKTHLEIDADLILGNDRKGELVSELEKVFEERRLNHAEGDQKNGAVVESLIDINHTDVYEPLALNRTEAHTRAFIKVQDGCNQFCSYCIIPYARGRVRSRAVKDVLTEVEMLAGNGVKEIVLTGIHLTSYGSDIDSDLLSLVKAAAGVQGIERVRLGSLEPGVITREFAEGLRAVPEFCPHFHLSLQSGCDTVLRRMNRHYTAAEFMERCDLLREVFRDPALTTDVIVGFPGETEEEFRETETFLQKIHFYETHIFRYSRREGTRAAAMPDQIPESVKADRSEILIALSQKEQAAYEKRHQGRTLEALFEEKAEYKGIPCFAGHTREYIRVYLRDDGNIDAVNRVMTGTLTEDGFFSL